MDANEMLGLGPDASAEEVRAAFRRLARQHHPDLHPVTERADALHQMQDITEARRRALQELDRRLPDSPVVVPLQRAGSPTRPAGQGREAYAEAELLVPRRPPLVVVPAQPRQRPGWTSAVVPSLIALLAGLAMYSQAPRGLVLGLLGLLMISCAVSLW